MRKGLKCCTRYYFVPHNDLNQMKNLFVVCCLLLLYKKVAQTVIYNIFDEKKLPLKKKFMSNLNINNNKKQAEIKIVEFRDKKCLISDIPATHIGVYFPVTTPLPPLFVVW